MLKHVTSLILAAALLLIQSVAAPVQAASYKLQPGDRLQLEVLEDSSLNRQLLVLPDGTVTVPMVGTIQASGRTVDQLRTAVAQALAPNFASKPTVYLSVAALAVQNPTAAAQTGPTMPVYLMGEVAKAGRADVPVGTTLLQALAIGGGFSNFAATKRVELLRRDASGQQRVYRYNYKALMSGAAMPAVVLQSGDVIVVPQRRLFE